MPTVPFSVGGVQWTSGAIKATRDGADYTFEALYPYVYSDESTGVTYYYVCLRNGTYGTYSNGIITQPVLPNEHHNDDYGNSYIAKYQNFMFFDVETSQQITSVALSVTNPSGSDRLMSITVQMQLQINGVDYYFIG